MLFSKENCDLKCSECPTVHSTKVALIYLGKYDVDLVFSFGKMDLNMKAIGIMIPQMVTDGLFIQTEMHMRDNGLMTKHTDMEFIYTLMEHDTKANGRMISSMAKALKHGLMELNMLETM